MKVIFLQDLPNVARAGDIKDVADGYGRNYLIPKKLAALASSPMARIAEMQQELRARSQAKTEAELSEMANQLEGSEITIMVQAGAKQRLYGSITNADIATEIENTTGLVIDKRKIELAKPIHELGSYEIAIRLAKEIVPKIKVTLVEKETT